MEVVIIVAMTFLRSSSNVDDDDDTEVLSSLFDLLLLVGVPVDGESAVSGSIVAAKRRWRLNLVETSGACRRRRCSDDD